MNSSLRRINKEVYESCALHISDFQLDPESQEYDACRFDLSGRKIICRNAKVTPKKAGQFVTFWKRKEKGPIEPLEAKDQFDFFVVNVRIDKNLGQFVFPKSVLIEKGLISTDIKEGKRAFRVYPIWDVPQSKHAERTQQWQLKYFYQAIGSVDLRKVKELYQIN